MQRGLPFVVNPSGAAQPNDQQKRCCKSYRHFLTFSFLDHTSRLCGSIPKQAITDGIADVRLTRADKRNALDNEMFRAIADAGERLKTAAGVRALVVIRRDPPRDSAIRLASPARQVPSSGSNT